MACGVGSEAEWAALLYSGAKLRDRSAKEDREVSHLCGNECCVEPSHPIIESHSDNMARTTCHAGAKCRCSSSTKCIVGKQRTDQNDAENSCVNWHLLV
jgi:hypothetical protein